MTHKLKKVFLLMVLGFTAVSCNNINININQGGGSSITDQSPSELDKISIAKFIELKDNTKYFTLEGTITKITSSSMGDFTLIDESGAISVEGLLESKDSLNKTWFASSSLKENDRIVLAGKYGFSGSTHKVVKAYYISRTTSEKPNPSTSSSTNPPTSSSSSNKITSFTSTEQRTLNSLFGFVVPFLEVSKSNEYSLTTTKEFSTYGVNEVQYKVSNISSTMYSNYLKLLSANYGEGREYTSEEDNLDHIIFTNKTSSMDLSFRSRTVTCLIYGHNNTTYTNYNKGLPSGSNGVYNVDFTKATKAKNVTGLGDYLGGCPTTGNVKVLVIPVDFSDKQATSRYDLNKIDTAFNGGTNASSLLYKSVKDYYYQASYGRLNLTFDVLDQWYRPSKSSSYYLSMDENDDPDQMIMEEILTKLESKMDLSTYDSDKNGYIDAIVMINTLNIDYEYTLKWAYRFWNRSCYTRFDGVLANDYLWASYDFLNETNGGFDGSSANNTYTFIHEFGHVLGAEDYYDTSYLSPTQYGPLDGIDVMDGMYGDHNPYTKFHYGWLTKSRLVTTDSSVTLTLEDFSKNGDTIILANDFDPTLGAYQEYYVLMYYKKNGLNADGNYFTKEGIVMYHIDSSLYQYTENNQTYYVVSNNNDYGSFYSTANYLIEYIKNGSEYVYRTGNSSKNIVTNNQENLIYSFHVDSLNNDSATLTFTKNK